MKINSINIDLSQSDIKGLLSALKVFLIGEDGKSGYLRKYCVEHKLASRMDLQIDLLFSAERDRELKSLLNICYGLYALDDRRSDSNKFNMLIEGISGEPLSEDIFYKGG
jgi:hypothetical protein